MKYIVKTTIKATRSNNSASCPIQTWYYGKNHSYDNCINEKDGMVSWANIKSFAKKNGYSSRGDISKCIENVKDFIKYENSFGNWEYSDPVVVEVDC